jgi:radical SAM superfamily enzyme YgiQ (UPF0313 family)
MAAKCLLIDPGMKTFLLRENLPPAIDSPQGCLSIASFLNQRGVETQIIAVDALVEDPVDGEPWGLHSIKPFIEETLARSDVRGIGVAFNYTVLAEDVHTVSSICRELAPKVPIFVGGNHPTFLPEQTLEEMRSVDIVVRGEGEWTTLALLTALEHGRNLSDVAGVTFRDEDGTIVSTPDRPLGSLDELPPLDYSLLPDRLVSSTLWYVSGSRGCWGKCTFCSDPAFWNGKQRRFPLQKVLRELEQIVREYRCEHLVFGDDSFSLKSSACLGDLERMGQALSGEKFRGAFIQTRVDAVSPEGLKKAREANIVNVQFGFESASPKVLRAMNKRTTPEMIPAACRMAKNAGLLVSGFWIVGHPGDDLEEFNHTYRAMKHLYGSGWLDGSSVFQYIPYPGTAPFHDPGRYDVEILSYDWSRYHLFRFDKPVCQLKAYAFDDIHASYQLLEATRRFAPLSIDGK